MEDGTEDSEKFDKEKYIEVIKQDTMIDHTEFKKYIAFFDIVLFGIDNQYIKLDKASCIFLAKDDDTAKYRSCFEMFQTCLLEGMPVKSMEFVSVCVCGCYNENETDDDDNIDDIINMFPGSEDGTLYK